MDLTIAIPSYKRPELLAATLARLIKRPWQRPVRYLVLVNQPDDGYDQALARFSGRSDIRILRQIEHRSVWQQCCALGNEVDTEYILHVSDDDDVDDEAVERYLGELDNNAGLLGAFAPVEFVDAAGKTQFLYNGVREVSVLGRGQHIELLRFLSDNEHWPELGIFRARAIQAVNAHHRHANSALLQLNQLLEHGAILFGQRPFYRLGLRQHDAAHHLGHLLPMDLGYLESALFSIDLIVAKARRQAGGELAPEAELELHARARLLHATRLRESFHSLQTQGHHAAAMAMALRLEAYGIIPNPEARVSYEIAALELAYDMLEAMSWLDRLVVYRIEPLVRYAHQRGMTRACGADTPEACMAFSETALFLCFEAHREALERVLPPRRIRSFESLTASFRR